MPARLPGGLARPRDLRRGTYDAIILAVAHRDFIALGPAALRALGKAK